jgi:hypothetical protein
LTLYWQDAAGGQNSVQKITGEDLVNLDDADFGPVVFRLDSYGQGETAKVSQRAQSDPLALLTYLDRFIEVEEVIAAEDATRDQLLEIQSKIEDAEIKVGRIPEYERYLATTQQQLKASEKANAAEVIQLQRKLASERELRSRIAEEWRAAKALIAAGEAKQKIEGLRMIADAADLSVGVDEFKAIVVGAAALEQKIGAVASQLEEQAAAFDVLMTEQMRLWKTKETDALRVIEVKRKELEAQGVRLDMAFIQKLAKDEAIYKKSLDVLKTWKPFLATQRQRRSLVHYLHGPALRPILPRTK